MVLLIMLTIMGLGMAAGLSFDTAYRVTCAVGCVLFVATLASDNSAALWPWFGAGASAVINAGLFLTPIVNRPTSRGEIMLFALPDSIAVLCARLAWFPVSSDHDRAQRQMVIFGAVVAVVFCGALYSAVLLAH